MRTLAGAILTVLGLLVIASLRYRQVIMAPNLTEHQAFMRSWGYWLAAIIATCFGVILMTAEER